VFDEALSGFFRNVDPRVTPPLDLPVNTPIGSLKARAVLVDMEEGVTSQLLRGPLRDLFDPAMVVNSLAGGGSGNNWAQGYAEYGPAYRERLMDVVTSACERCDSLQSFFVVHSLGGGTGAGLGTYILETLADEFPEVYRFANVVFPSVDDDVVTSPYNTVLALSKLTEHADAVLPVDNDALAGLVNRREEGVVKEAIREGARVDKALAKAQGGATGGSRANTFAAMNEIAASMMCDLTASMRFPGSLNVDLNEITMNLVPFPRLHYLVPSRSPALQASATAGAQSSTNPSSSSSSSSSSVSSSSAPRGLPGYFSEVFSSKNQLIRIEPRGRMYLALALLFRGDFAVTDIHSAVAKTRTSLRMPAFSHDAFKIGLCSVTGAARTNSLLCLANTAAISDRLDDFYTRFAMLYRAKAHVHHYAKFMETSVFDEAGESLRSLVNEYKALEVQRPQRPSRWSVI
jgi:tubulin epsilon